jgi:hypothetical protein
MVSEKLNPSLTFTKMIIFTFIFTFHFSHSFKPCFNAFTQLMMMMTINTGLPPSTLYHCGRVASPTRHPYGANHLATTTFVQPK